MEDVVKAYPNGAMRGVTHPPAWCDGDFNAVEARFVVLPSGGQFGNKEVTAKTNVLR
jgi:hypothetical protein